VTSIALPPVLVSEVSADYEKIFKCVTISPQVGVVMGSESDWPTMKLAVSILKQFGIPYTAEVVSAHRTPKLLVEYAHNARRRGIKLIIAGAGGAAHLPGMLAAETTLPILGVPIKSSVLSGVDSLYSIVQMPKGVPVATFAIGDAGAVNAALFAVAILAGGDTELSKKLDEFREKQVRTVLAMELPDE
jgi:5-(carboxyamino)imidazole ribonucleotide mutase